LDNKSNLENSIVELIFNNAKNHHQNQSIAKKRMSVSQQVKKLEAFHTGTSEPTADISSLGMARPTLHMSF
jgi:hypothetical protein